MIIISMLQRYWVNHWKPRLEQVISKDDLETCMKWVMPLVFIFIIAVIFMVCAVSFAEEGVQQVNVETREVAGEPDTTPPAPPTGIRVQQPYIEAGEIEQRYEDYAPTGDIRMKDGQGEWVEYSQDGAESGDGWQQ